MSVVATDGVRKPVRLVHLGLGAFFRAHQAPFTQFAEDGGRWGYAAFTVRSPRQADILRAQGCVYPLVERSEHGDRVTLVDQLSAVHDGAEVDALCDYLASTQIAVVTLTITEVGYSHPESGDAEAIADAELVRRRLAGEQVIPASPLARLVIGLDARRRSDAGRLAVVPCDNLPRNGEIARRAVLAFAAVDRELADWIARSVSFVSTAVDRITPRQQSAGGERGPTDQSAAEVVTEPYAEWVLAGDFPAGRPRWETAGAIFTADIEPFERRKLRMLNGAHTILALAGLRRGHATIDEALQDPALRALVTAWWEEAAATLPPDLDAVGYADALTSRFGNPRLRHRLDQIAANTTAKLETRIVPVIRERLEAGLPSAAGTLALAEWAHAVDEGLVHGDPAEGSGVDRIRSLVPGLEVRDLVRALADTAPEQVR